jgi:hypothetical protein
MEFFRKGSPLLNADAPHTLGLLRPRRERPSRPAAEHCDELAPFQLIEVRSVQIDCLKNRLAYLTILKSELDHVG